MALWTDVVKYDTNANKPVAGTAGRLYFESDTGLAYYDNGSDWKLISDNAGELSITVDEIFPSTTGGSAALAQVEYGTNDVDLKTLDFDQSTDEFAQFTLWMPDTWDGSTITFKAAWTAASGSGDVIWGLQGRAYADDDAIDQAWGTAQTVTDTLLATDDLHYSPVSSALTLAGTPAAGQLVQFRVYRDADAAGDTHSADAKLLAIKVYYGKA